MLNTYTDTRTRPHTYVGYKKMSRRRRQCSKEVSPAGWKAGAVGTNMEFELKKHAENHQSVTVTGPHQLGKVKALYRNVLLSVYRTG